MSTTETPLQRIIRVANERADTHNPNLSNKTILISTLLPKYHKSTEDFFKLNTNSPFHIGQFLTIWDSLSKLEGGGIYLQPVDDNPFGYRWNEYDAIKYKMAMLDVQDGVLLPLDNTVRLQDKQRYIVAYVDLIETYLVEVKQLVQYGQTHDIGAEGVDYRHLSDLIHRLNAHGIHMTGAIIPLINDSKSYLANPDKNSSLLDMVVLNSIYPTSSLYVPYKELHKLPSDFFKTGHEIGFTQRYNQHPGKRFNAYCANHVAALLGCDAGMYSFVNRKVYRIPKRVWIYFGVGRLPVMIVDTDNGDDQYYHVLGVKNEFGKKHLVISEVNEHSINSIIAGGNGYSQLFWYVVRSSFASIYFDNVQVTDEILNYDIAQGVIDRWLPFKLNISEGNYELKGMSYMMEHHAFNEYKQARYSKFEHEDVLDALTNGDITQGDLLVYVRPTNIFNSYSGTSASMANGYAQSRPYPSLGLRYYPSSVMPLAQNKVGFGHLVTMNPDRTYTVSDRVYFDVYGVIGSPFDLSYGIDSNSAEYNEYVVDRGYIEHKIRYNNDNSPQYENPNKPPYLMRRGKYQYRKQYRMYFGGLNTYTGSYSGSNQLLTSYFSDYINDLGLFDVVSHFGDNIVKNEDVNVRLSEIGGERLLTRLRLFDVSYPMHKSLKWYNKAPKISDNSGYHGLLMSTYEVGVSGVHSSSSTNIRGVLSSSSMRMAGINSPHLGELETASYPYNAPRGNNSLNLDKFGRTESLSRHYIGMDKDVLLAHAQVCINNTYSLVASYVTENNVNQYHNIQSDIRPGNLSVGSVDLLKDLTNCCNKNYSRRIAKSDGILNPVYFIPYGYFEYLDTPQLDDSKRYMGYDVILSPVRKPSLFLFTGRKLSERNEIIHGIINGDGANDANFRSRAVEHYRGIKDNIAVFPTLFMAQYLPADSGLVYGLPGVICNFVDKTSSNNHWYNNTSNMYSISDILVRSENNKPIYKHDTVNVLLTTLGEPYCDLIGRERASDRFTINGEYAHGHNQDRDIYLDDDGVLHLYVSMFYTTGSHRNYVIDLDGRFVFNFNVANITSKLVKDKQYSGKALKSFLIHISLVSTCGENNTFIFNQYRQDRPNYDGIYESVDALKVYPTIEVNVIGSEYDNHTNGIPYRIRVSEIASIAYRGESRFRKNMVLFASNFIFRAYFNNNSKVPQLFHRDRNKHSYHDTGPIMKTDGLSSFYQYVGEDIWEIH